MNLYISQEDIDLAKGRYSIWHPIYLAIWRQTGASWAYHDGYLWPVCGDPVKVPKDLKAWAYGYLLRQHMQPADFEIDLPDVVGCGHKRKLKEEFFP